MAILIKRDLIVGLGAAAARGLETVTHFDTLDRLNTHERTRKTRVKTAIPVNKRTKTYRATGRDDLNHATESFALRVCGINLSDHALRGLSIETTQRISIERFDIGLARKRGVGWRRDGTDCSRV